MRRQPVSTNCCTICKSFRRIGIVKSSCLSLSTNSEGRDEVQKRRLGRLGRETVDECHGIRDEFFQLILSGHCKTLYDAGLSQIVSGAMTT